MYKGIKNKRNFKGRQVSTNYMSKTLHLNNPITCNKVSHDNGECVLKRSVVIGQPWQWGVCREGVDVKKVARPNANASLKISFLHLNVASTLETSTPIRWQLSNNIHISCTHHTPCARWNKGCVTLWPCHLH